LVGAGIAMVRTVDGSVGEGGGQVLRYAVSTCALLGEELRVYNIRAKRNPPGLRPQHIAAIRAVAEVCDAYVEGLSVGSSTIFLRCGRPRAGRYSFDTGTAGSTALVLQSLLPVLCFADGECEVELRGGTNNPLAPPIDYIERVLLPALSKMGVRAELEIVRRGFYPRGQGIVRVRTRPISSIRPIQAAEAGIEGIEVFAYSCNLPDHIVSRMASTASELLKKSGFREVTLETEALGKGDSKNSVDPGTGILIVVRLDNGLSMGFDALGERGVPAEEVAKRAVREALDQLAAGAPIDKHLADQLVIWMALAAGESRIRATALTTHASTGIAVVGDLTGAKFWTAELGQRGVEISCTGIGYTPR